MYLEKFNIKNEALWRLLNIKNYYISKDLSIKLRMAFHLRSIATSVDELSTSDSGVGNSGNSGWCNNCNNSKNGGLFGSGSSGFGSWNKNNERNNNDWSLRVFQTLR